MKPTAVALGFLLVSSPALAAECKLMWDGGKAAKAHHATVTELKNSAYDNFVHSFNETPVKSNLHPERVVVIAKDKAETVTILFFTGKCVDLVIVETTENFKIALTGKPLAEEQTF